MTHIGQIIEKELHSPYVFGVNPVIAKNARSHGSQDDSIAIELMYIIYLEDRA